ncbi:uncharacterized protein LOC141932862 isoform X1 [Strix aluco]|uniref:uncharacterized protein LOC141932862 isoform X1 n=1 Tax=Strix aluco TaxID=111821 RepID=UPI003DA375EA
MMAAWLCGTLIRERLSAGALPREAARGMRPSWCAPAAEMGCLLPLETCPFKAFLLVLHITLKLVELHDYEFLLLSFLELPRASCQHSDRLRRATTVLYSLVLSARPGSLRGILLLGLKTPTDSASFFISAGFTHVVKATNRRCCSSKQQRGRCVGRFSPLTGVKGKRAAQRRAFSGQGSALCSPCAPRQRGMSGCSSRSQNWPKPCHAHGSGRLPPLPHPSSAPPRRAAAPARTVSPCPHRRRKAVSPRFWPSGISFCLPKQPPCSCLGHGKGSLSVEGEAKLCPSTPTCSGGARSTARPSTILRSARRTSRCSSWKCGAFRTPRCRGGQPLPDHCCGVCWQCRAPPLAILPSTVSRGGGVERGAMRRQERDCGRCLRGHLRSPPAV